MRPFVELKLTKEEQASLKKAALKYPDMALHNGEYIVFVREMPSLRFEEHLLWPPMTHLSISRQDGDVIRDWRHLQEIKNLVTDPEREAVELYPAESRLVDGSNQFHLWVLHEGDRFPFGFQERLVIYDATLVDGRLTRQRAREAWDEHER